MLIVRTSICASLIPLIVGSHKEVAVAAHASGDGTTLDSTDLGSDFYTVSSTSAGTVIPPAWTTSAALLADIERAMPNPSFSSGLGVDLSRNTDVTPIGTVMLANLLAQTVDSVIYEVVLEGDRSGRRFVAKYLNDCTDVLSRRPGVTLSKEHSMLMLAKDTGVTPNVYYLSPMIEIKVGGSVKTKSVTFSKHWVACQRLGAKVQMMLQDKGGDTVDSHMALIRNIHPGSPTILRAGLYIGLKTISMLDGLHGLGILHGDIHGGNILFKHPKSSPALYDASIDDLMLVDLGMATLLSVGFNTATSAPLESHLNPMNLSPWHLAGERLGRRDDVYRAIEMMAVMLSGGKLDAAFNKVLETQWMSASHGGKQVLSDAALAALTVHSMRLAKSYNLFTHDPELGYECLGGMGLEDSHRIEFESGLQSVMNLVKSLTGPDDEPPYADMIRILQGLIDKLDGLYPPRVTA